MIRQIIVLNLILFGFCFSASAGQYHKDSGVKKAKDQKEKKLKEERNQKAEADAALKKVEAMTRQARENRESDDKKK